MTTCSEHYDNLSKSWRILQYQSHNEEKKKELANNLNQIDWLDKLVGSSDQKNDFDQSELFLEGLKVNTAEGWDVIIASNPDEPLLHLSIQEKKELADKGDLQNNIMAYNVVTTQDAPNINYNQNIVEFGYKNEGKIVYVDIAIVTFFGMPGEWAKIPGCWKENDKRFARLQTGNINNLLIQLPISQEKSEYSFNCSSTIKFVFQNKGNLPVVDGGTGLSFIDVVGFFRVAMNGSDGMPEIDFIEVPSSAESNIKYKEIAESMREHMYNTEK